MILEKLQFLRQCFEPELFETFPRSSFPQKQREAGFINFFFFRQEPQLTYKFTNDIIIGEMSFPVWLNTRFSVFCRAGNEGRTLIDYGSCPGWLDFKAECFMNVVFCAFLIFFRNVAWSILSIKSLILTLWPYLWVQLCVVHLECVCLFVS